MIISEGNVVDIDFDTFYTLLFTNKFVTLTNYVVELDSPECHS